MSGPLDEVIDRLGWARKQIEEIEVQIRHVQRVGGQLYDIRVEPQPDGVSYEIRAHRLRPIPREIGYLVADSIHNLRACLDNAAWALASAYGKPDPHTAFPVCLRETSFRKSVSAYFTNVPHGAIQIIENVQPYKGPNLREHWLRLLHGRWNADKHRVPIIAAAIPGTGTLLTADVPVADFWIATDIDPADDDVVVGSFRVNAPGDEATLQTHFAFQICIKERGRLLPRSLPGVLVAHHALVGDVLSKLRPYVP